MISLMFYSGMIVAIFTLISKIFGLLRELFIASLFGSGNLADSVNVAFKFPSLFRCIFAEGAFSIVFIPMFSKKLLISKETANQFAGQVLTFLTITLVILILILQALMPYLVYIITPGFYNNHVKFDLTILLCRITTPYLFFISITSLFVGVLNSFKKFTASSVLPIIFSVVIIACTIVFQHYFKKTISISLSLLTAGLAQMTFMYYRLFSIKMPISIKIDFINSDLIKLLKNMLPVTISSGILQINFLISQSIASFLPGAISILAYADRIYQFPLSIIGISLSTILLPELSKVFNFNYTKKIELLLDKSITVCQLLSIPSSIAIISLAKPIIHVLYQRGEFNSSDTILTAKVVSILALGLPAFILIKVLNTVFYANQDTRSPLRIAIYSVLGNVISNFLLVDLFKVIGLAISSSLTAWFNVFLLHRGIVKAYSYSFLSKNICIFSIKVLISSSIMSLFILIVNYYCSTFFYSLSLFSKISILFIIVLISIIIFIICCVLFKLHKTLKNKLDY